MADDQAVANIRDVFGALIGQRVVDVLQHDQEEWEEAGEFFVEFCFERGERVRFHPGDDGRLQLFTEDDGMPVTKENLRDVFTYHAPTELQVAQLQAVRDAGYNLAAAILEHCPPCADQQAAIRLVREAVMTANAAIVLRGAV